MEDKILKNVYFLFTQPYCTRMLGAGAFPHLDNSVVTSVLSVTFNPHLTVHEVYHPPNGLFLVARKPKRKWPNLIGNLHDILCNHFDENNSDGTPCPRFGKAIEN